MDVLNYTYRTNIESPAQFLAYLNAFAVAQGWTTVEWRENTQWTGSPGSYDWAAGDETYLEISSDGYGVQPLRYRFRLDPDDSSNLWIYISAARPDTPAYSNLQSAHPVAQAGASWWNGVRQRMSIPNGRFPSAWFWGDDKIIIAIMQVSAILYQSFAIGLPRLFSEFQSNTELHCLWVGSFSYRDETFNRYWHNFESNQHLNFLWCFAGGLWSSPESSVFWWDGEARGASQECGASMRILRGGSWASPTWTESGEYPLCKNVICNNTWTGKRVGISPVFFIKDFTGLSPAYPDQPIGTLPFVYLPWSGLSPGETVTFGLDKYKVFPLNYYLDEYGVGLRYE